MKRALNDFLFAPRAVCMGCMSVKGAEEGFLCAKCRNMLAPLYLTFACAQDRCPSCGQVLDKSACGQCGYSGKSVFKTVSAYDYAPPVSNLIQMFKYRDVRALSDWMAEEMEKALGKSGVSADVIVPVPIHFIRKLSRGYNQSDLLARALSARLGIPCENVLRRVRYTKKQSKLSREKRTKPMDQAFLCKGCVKGKSVLLIDDVITTGTTASACARRLLEAGADAVRILTLAKA